MKGRKLKSTPVPANMSLESKIPLLKDRALMFQRARLFFDELQLIEVDTPILSPAPPIDLHIDIMKTKMHDGKAGYFHSSPEYAMKRLISAGLTDIYQISHVYRYGEEGALHNPEFTMVEWYQKGCTFDKIIDDTLNFIRLFLGDLPAQAMSYRQMLLHFAGIDYLIATDNDLRAYIKENSDSTPSSLSSWDKDTLLQYIVSFHIEPHLGKNELFVLKHFPASQAALSQVQTLGEEKVAERFEVYFEGIELANGYHELTDATEQRKRLVESNMKRLLLGKEDLPLDNNFIAALEKGLPDCCGVAVGFDRLMMLRHKKTILSEAIAFAWKEL